MNEKPQCTKIQLRRESWGVPFPISHTDVNKLKIFPWTGKKMWFSLKNMLNETGFKLQVGQQNKG